MKNWFKYILITTVFMFIGFNGVEARRANTCTYNLDSGTIIIETDDNKSSAIGQYSGGIWRSIFKDVETVYTDNDKKWTSSECPKYVLYKTSGSNKLYGSNKKSTLEKLATNQKYKSFKIVNLGYVNSVAVSTMSDNNIMTCSYEKDGYTFYVNNEKKTVEISDKSSSSCIGGPYVSYDEFSNGCPKHMYKIITTVPGGVTCSYSHKQSNMGNGIASELTDSTNDTANINSEKAKIDYADSCDDAGETVKLLKQVYTLLRYLIPVIIIGLGIVDFIKVVATGEDKAFKEVWSKFVKRIIIGIVILILPAILSLIINLSGITDTYGVDPNNIFCILK